MGVECAVTCRKQYKVNNLVEQREAVYKNYYRMKDVNCYRRFKDSVWLKLHMKRIKGPQQEACLSLKQKCLKCHFARMNTIMYFPTWCAIWVYLVWTGKAFGTYWMWWSKCNDFVWLATSSSIVASIISVAIFIYFSYLLWIDECIFKCKEWVLK